MRKERREKKKGMERELGMEEKSVRGRKVEVRKGRRESL